MPDLPTIAILAATLARHSYLAAIAKMAGFEEVTREDKVPAAPMIWLLDGVSPPPDQAGLFLSFGKELPEKMRAQDLIKKLQKVGDGQTAPPSEIRVGYAILHVHENLWVVENASPIRLTEKETRLICYLKDRATAVSRGELLNQIWEYVDGVETHTIETHIYRLRQKIEQDPSNPLFLMTVNDGYKLCGD